MELFVSLLLLALAVAILWIGFSFISAIFSPNPITPSSAKNRNSTGMDEGDYHSGPEGYSPNTAYPETQYGSMFDEESEWNEDEWNH